METKKELQKEIKKCIESDQHFSSLETFYDNVKDIVARMPDDKSETKPEPSLLEVAMNLHFHSFKVWSIKDCFDRAEELIAENEKRKK